MKKINSLAPASMSSASLLALALLVSTISLHCSETQKNLFLTQKDLFLMGTTAALRSGYFFFQKARLLTYDQEHALVAKKESFGHDLASQVIKMLFTNSLYWAFPSWKPAVALSNFDGRCELNAWFHALSAAVAQHAALFKQHSMPSDSLVSAYLADLESYHNYKGFVYSLSELHSCAPEVLRRYRDSTHQSFEAGFLSVAFVNEWNQYISDPNLQIKYLELTSPNIHFHPEQISLSHQASLQKDLNHTAIVPNETATVPPAILIIEPTYQFLQDAIIKNLSGFFIGNHKFFTHGHTHAHAYKVPEILFAKAYNATYKLTGVMNYHTHHHRRYGHVTSYVRDRHESWIHIDNTLTRRVDAHDPIEYITQHAPGISREFVYVRVD